MIAYLTQSDHAWLLSSAGKKQEYSKDQGKEAVVFQNARQHVF